MLPDLDLSKNEHMSPPDASRGRQTYRPPEGRRTNHRGDARKPRAFDQPIDQPDRGGAVGGRPSGPPRRRCGALLEPRSTPPAGGRPRDLRTIKSSAASERFVRGGIRALQGACGRCRRCSQRKRSRRAKTRGPSPSDRTNDALKGACLEARGSWYGNRTHDVQVMSLALYPLS